MESPHPLHQPPKHITFITAANINNSHSRGQHHPSPSPVSATPLLMVLKRPATPPTVLKLPATPRTVLRRPATLRTALKPPVTRYTVSRLTGIRCTDRPVSADTTNNLRLSSNQHRHLPDVHRLASRAHRSTTPTTLSTVDKVMAATATTGVMENNVDRQTTIP